MELSTPCMGFKNKRSKASYLARLKNGNNPLRRGKKNEVKEVVATEEVKKVGPEEVLAEALPVGDDKLEGNRVINLEYYTDNVISLQYNHSKTCKMGRIYLKTEEQRKVFCSHMVFGCNKCDFITKRKTHPDDAINKAAVLGTLATGGTYTTLQQIMATMDIPVPSGTTYHKMEESIMESGKDLMAECMQQAAQVERDIALKNGKIDEDGDIYIRVYVDGGWSHRSYGHTYNANSGTAIVIGCETNKILYLGVHNKYCSICAIAKNAGKEPKEHKCYKNWSGSSGSMEASILVQAFNHAKTAYGIIFKEFVADGDSSAFSKIRQHCSYGHKVTKVECKNHAIKNYGKALYALKKNCTAVPLAARKILTTFKIKELQQVAQKALHCNANGNVEQLKVDLQNGPKHLFGNHLNCSEPFCDLPGTIDKNRWEPVKATGLLTKIQVSLERLMKKSDMLIANVTSNKAETYMSLLCKFNAGKRLNLTQRGSFEGRAYLAGLANNLQILWIGRLWEKIIGRPISNRFQGFLSASQKIQDYHHKRFSAGSDTPAKKRRVVKDEIETGYGPEAEQPSEPSTSAGCQTESKSEILAKNSPVKKRVTKRCLFKAEKETEHNNGPEANHPESTSAEFQTDDDDDYEKILIKNLPVKKARLAKIEKETECVSEADQLEPTHADEFQFEYEQMLVSLNQSPVKTKVEEIIEEEQLELTSTEIQFECKEILARNIGEEITEAAQSI